ncbi:hypothetical protein B0T19DRAFT_168921 [Cercophora scortea]|uniref:Uncharacterized protein n=1 Tax=Cercophora scortea TaxID=314031 RepID=A0AAE0MCY1_9PEZI|nr:hypothetical protein B0T19DRAFT_168921 [Cercophora scortea]
MDTKHIASLRPNSSTLLAILHHESRLTPLNCPCLKPSTRVPHLRGDHDPLMTYCKIRTFFPLYRLSACPLLYPLARLLPGLLVLDIWCWISGAGCQCWVGIYLSGSHLINQFVVRGTTWVEYLSGTEVTVKCMSACMTGNPSITSLLQTRSL